MYEHISETNSSFSKSTPGLQLIWDSTSLSLLKACPRKYQYAMLDQIRSNRTAIPLSFGILYHAALEAYDHGKAEGLSHSDARDKALDFALTSSALGQEFDLITPNLSPETADTARTRQSLVRALVWYLDEFEDDATRTIILANGKPAVELSFKLHIDLPTPDGDYYTLSGHLDRVVDYAGTIYVQDRKTTSAALTGYYFNRYNPDTQMSLYTFAAKAILHTPASGVMIDAVQLGVNFNRFARQIIGRTPGQLQEFYDDTLHWIKQAESFARRGHWPMNETACSMYGACPYRPICSVDPKVRPMIANSSYVKSVWDPGKARGGEID
jgi:hypothetical protein